MTDITDIKGIKTEEQKRNERLMARITEIENIVLRKKEWLEQARLQIQQVDREVISMVGGLIELRNEYQLGGGKLPQPSLPIIPSKDEKEIDLTKLIKKGKKK